MSETNYSELKIFSPICEQKGCGGYLNLLFNEYSFCIDYECEKNKRHNKENVSLDKFIKLNIKEQNLNKCYKCSLNLENNLNYICKICNNNYCTNCFMSDIHIKKNIQNLMVNSNKCPIDQKELTYYCLDCGKNICYYCFKKDEDNSPHHNHQIDNILDHIPSLKQINTFKQKIKSKSEKFYVLLNSINNWQKKLNQKIDKIKENLMNELELLNKLFLNFSQNYLNFVRFSNFEYFYKHLCNLNNSYLENFIKTSNFKNQTKIIIDYLFNFESKKNYSDVYLNRLYYLGDEEENILIEEYTDNIFLNYSQKNIRLEYYNKKNNQIYYFIKSKVDFEDEIYSISFSIDKKIIYANLLNKKKVIFIKVYSEDDYRLEITDEEIVDEGEEFSHFNNCIQLSNKYMAIVDGTFLGIWSNQNINSKQYSKLSNIDLQFKIYNLILVDNKYLVYSQGNQTISFFKIKTLSTEKTIKAINCDTLSKSLFIIDNYIIVGCHSGIVVVSIKSKELIQYIQMATDCFNFLQICKYNENDIFVFNIDILTLEKYKFLEGSFILTAEYKINKDKEESDNSEDNNLFLTNYFSIKKIISNNGFILFCGDNIYISYEK